jgi:hypothetical protein
LTAWRSFPVRDGASALALAWMTFAPAECARSENEKSRGLTNPRLLGQSYGDRIRGSR